MNHISLSLQPIPHLKSYTTKEKSLATSFDVEQTMATLETTINLQFPQKTYLALVERNYKHMSTLSTHAPDMRTTTKFSTMSQALYKY